MHHITLAKSEQDLLIEKAKKIAKKIYEGKIIPGSIDPEMTQLVSKYLVEATFKGFGNNFDDIDYNTPDYNMLVNLEKNCYHFSAAKNYQELRDYNNALRDEAGNIRSFDDFMTEATKIGKQYNIDWLKTEYNFAINASTLAGKWVDFQKNKEDMPLLRFSTVGDRRVRQSHRALEGITRHIDDAFWDTHYPPLDFGCRCGVDQITSGAITDIEKINLPPIPKMFQVNLAKQGLNFPPGHPYYDGVPSDQIDLVTKNMIPDRTKKE